MHCLGNYHQSAGLPYCLCQPAEIDQLNILQASLLAMKRAVEGLCIEPELVLVDGNRLPNGTIELRPSLKVTLKNRRLVRHQF